MNMITRLLAALTLSACGANAALAQTYPNKPINIVVGYAPGGGVDVIARLVAAKLSQRLGQPVLVENKPGASGNIASEFVARARPDGYTLLFNNSTLTVNEALGIRQSFDALKDLKYIAAVASTPVAIGVNPSVPVKTVAELAVYARGQGGKLSYSSCGNGSPQNFTGARFADVAKASMVHVPYKGCTPAVIDGVGGQVSVLFNTVSNMEPQVRAGRLRFIAVASQQRLSFKPDLPTVSETKGFEGFSAELWFGLIGPAGMPADVAKRLEQEVLAAMQDKQLQKDFADRQISVRVRDSAQFEKDAVLEVASWKQLSRELGIKLD
jgi:tripartite-type tricarboxylate transporter receptor subunit TctC